jgi:hypothetical protein
MESRIVVCLVTELLDDQLSHGLFDFLNIIIDIVNSVFDNLVFFFLLVDFFSCNILGPFLSLTV